MNSVKHQFTTRQLLVAIGVIGVLLALFACKPRLWIYVAAIASGIVILALGARRHRRSWLLTGFLLLIVGAGLLNFNITVARCVGVATLPVHVLVIDTNTFEPVTGATIEVLDGPWSPMEGKVSGTWLQQFTPATMSAGVSPLVTNAGGQCDFTHKFWASWTEGALIETSGSIRTGKTWLRVSAAGLGSVLMPMDGQSERGSRNYRDRSPLCVTVPLQKQADK